MKTPDRPSSAPLLALGLSFWSAKALLCAVELGVFAALAEGPRTLEDLTAALKLQGRGAEDFFDALVSLGLLERGDHTYANTAAVAAFLVPDGPSYIGGALEMANARTYPLWGKLTEALRTGHPQNEAPAKQDYYGSLNRDKERLRTFLRGMTGLSMSASAAIAAKLPWTNYETFVDVGGAQGVLAIQLAEAHAHLSGASFDLPPVGPFFEENVSAHGLTPRLRFYAGDFLVDPLPPADVLIMGHVLHNWSLEQKKLLIRKAYEALNEGGMLVIYEALIDDDRRRNSFGLLMSLHMLLVTPGGFVFTGAQCREWLAEAGFTETRVEHLDGPDWAVIGVKTARPV